MKTHRYFYGRNDIAPNFSTLLRCTPLRPFDFRTKILCRADLRSETGLFSIQANDKASNQEFRPRGSQQVTGQLPGEQNRREAAAQAREKELNPNILEPEPPKKVLGSITNETSLEEFMTTAELTNRNFEAEKSSDFRIISTKESSIVATEDLKGQSFAKLNKKYGSLLRIPRRPKPGTYNTAEELTALENEMFLEWRRSLSVLTEVSCMFDAEFDKTFVNKESIKELEKKKKAKLAVKKEFETKYRTEKSKWLFTKLRF
ncbi:ribosomal l27e protein family domain-containing protein [Ditylenchus destructor]|nr:ribosomal l27e protein family domain-containing protein [Ditylenchus destructor]